MALAKLVIATRTTFFRIEKSDAVPANYKHASLTLGVLVGFRFLWSRTERGTGILRASFETSCY